MKTYELDYKSGDGKDYFNIVLDLQTGEYFQVKNASCTAVVEDFIDDLFKLSKIESAYQHKRFKIFHMGTDNNINLDKIYKKYHKYFNRKGKRDGSCY